MTFVTLAPANKKPAAGAGSAAKLGTSSIGKPSAQIGKSSFLGSTSKSSNFSTPPKSSGSEKTASIFGASTKSSYFGGSTKDKYFGTSAKSSTTTAGSLFGGSAKTSNATETSAKYSNTPTKSYSTAPTLPRTDNVSSLSAKNSSGLGSNDKYSNALGSSAKTESKPTFVTKTENSSTTKSYSVLGSSGKNSNTNVLGSPVKSVGNPLFSGKIDTNSKSSSVLGTTPKYVNTVGSPVKAENKSIIGGKTDSSPAKNTNILGSSGSYSNSPVKKAGMLASTGIAANILLSSNTNKDLGSSGKHNPYGTPVKSDSMLGSTGGKSANNVMPNNKTTFRYDEKSNKLSIPPVKSSIVHDPNKTYPSFMSPKEKKPTTRFSLIWLPIRKRNKKKDAVHNPHNYQDYNRSPSMYNYMSGDSPDYQSQKKKDEETLLVPDRAKVTSVAVNTGITAASIDMPPDGSGPTNPEEQQEFLRRDSEESKEAAGDTNEKNKIDKEEYLENNDDYANKSPEKKWDNEKQGDKVDSVYLRPPPAHKARSTTSTNEEEDCGIKCLYYTLQCCDCVLM